MPASPSRDGRGLAVRERIVAERVAELGAGGGGARAAEVGGEAAARREQAAVGRSNWPGTTPGMEGSRRPRRARAARRAGPRCRDGADRRRGRRTGCSSTCWPAYCTTTRSRRLGDHAHVMGDEDEGHAGLALQPEEEVEDLRLDGDVERRGRLVGDQELRVAGDRHGDHHALAHAAGKLVRERRRAGLSGAGMPTSRSSSIDARAGARPCPGRDASSAPRRSGSRP